MPPKCKPATGAQVADLQRQISALRVGARAARRGAAPRGRGSTRGRGRGQTQIPAAYQQSMPSRATMSGSSLGVVTIKGRELLTTVKIPANKTSFGATYGINPLNDYAPPQVKAMGSLYSMYRLNWYQVEWEPICGTTTNGAVTMGVSPNAPNAPSSVTLANTARCQPNVSGPLYTPHRISFPKNYLNEKRWYEIEKQSSYAATEDPCVLYFYMDTDSTTNERSMGRLWANYSYVFEGFTKGE